jgi:transposase
MPSGRLTKYNPEMCEKLASYGAQGFTKHQMAAELGISWSMFARYENDHELFRDAVKEAVALSQVFWDKELQKAATGINKDANATLMIFTMKNRFKDSYGDMTKVEHSGKLNINTTALTDDELLALIEKK